MSFFCCVKVDRGPFWGCFLGNIWHRCEFTEKDCLNNCKSHELSYVSLDVFSQNSLPVHNDNKSGGKRWKYPRPPRSVYSTTWLYCDAVISWNSLSDHFVKLRLNSRSVEAPFHYPQMVLHVQWWGDCGTVHEQLSKQLIKCFTVKWTSPQSKRRGFEIKKCWIQDLILPFHPDLI